LFSPFQDVEISLLRGFFPHRIPHRRQVPRPGYAPIGLPKQSIPLPEKSASATQAETLLTEAVRKMRIPQNPVRIIGRTHHTKAWQTGKARRYPDL